MIKFNQHTTLPAVALLVAVGCNQGVGNDVNTNPQITNTRSAKMVKGPSLSRRPPRTVDPLEREGIRYEQVMDMPDIDNRTGWLRATRISSGEVLWNKQVYQHERDSRMERDVQEFYFRSMSFDADRNEILIENERGERYAVDPANGDSSLLD